MRAKRGLSELARAGFVELDAAAEALAELEGGGVPVDAELLGALGRSADPDQAVAALEQLLRRDAAALGAVLADAERTRLLVTLLGASQGIAEFLLRWPEELQAVTEPLREVPDAAAYRRTLLRAVGDRRGFAGLSGDPARVALRRAYRRELSRLAAYDLTLADPIAGIDRIGAALAALAEAALEAALSIARSQLVAETVGGAGREEVIATELVIIAMGKTGAQELNYLSDVDVIFAAEAAEGSELSSARMLEVATRLARLAMRAIDEPALEPGLWQVDANLRPEGKDGALVRTVESHQHYYERWAHGWEFQALLKARPAAGSAEVGQRYLAALQPMVWSSAGRDNFVESVQRMRGLVTDNIPADEVDIQLKLGAGGLRDVEFTVQLLQLVHGQADEQVRQRSTLAALAALARGGYIGRAEAEAFSQDYRYLRLLEHRLQLAGLKRTHLMPRSETQLRILARATGSAGAGAEGLWEQWQAVKTRVRGLHERLFYRPLLAAVARLPEEDLTLSSEQAKARLAAIGFVAPDRALDHIAALTQGVSRRAAIQRHLLPVLLQWFAEGADPDHGLLAFRKLSEALGETAWYLRMLRDSAGAAERLCTVLSHSRYVSDLLERIPESVAWFGAVEELRPRTAESLLEESTATVDRHADAAAAAAALRTARRRETLRLAIGAMLGLISIEESGQGLADIATAMLSGVLRLIRRESGAEPEFAVIAMGRYGGEELGFGSDLDVMYVYRAADEAASPQAQSRAEDILARIAALTEDALLPFELDIGLRPEGKNGAAVRSLNSYRAYYERWSLTWESQALLRARPVVGDPSLLADFGAMIDAHRYPEQLDARAIREVKRIKARVEAERLPQGVDPRRHLKLGRGSLSDVEWLVQLWQLQHAREHPALRTPSTLKALAAAEQAGIVSAADGRMLREAWVLASRVRSALTLWSRANSDVLPSDIQQLEGMARLLEYPPGAGQRLEDDYLRTTRQARGVFERLFYDSGNDAVDGNGVAT